MRLWLGVIGNRFTVHQPDPMLNRHHFERMLRAAGDRVIDTRNKAMLAVAYDTLMRRSELVDLDVDNITLAEDGSGGD